MNLENEINKKASLWIMKEKEGLNFQERAKLDLWLENKHHKKAYDENKKLLGECFSLDDEFVQKMKKQIVEEKKVSNFKKNSYIAACIVLFSLVIFSIIEVKSYFIPSFSEHYLASNNKLMNITLPDSSRIDLDIKSHVDVDFYSDKREVFLKDGKALFSVQTDKTRPFIVHSGKTKVEVLGTKFEVINLDGITKINVIEGLVKVSQYLKNGKEKTFIQLGKEQSFTLSDNGKVLENKNTEVQNIATWKDSIIKFEKHTLKSAFLMFQRYSNKNVSFENYELSQLKITGKFSTEHFEDFLSSIKIIYSLEIEEEKDLIKISKK